MPPSISALASRWVPDSLALRFLWRVGPIAAIHAAALVIVIWTEQPQVPHIVSALLVWGLLNFAWLAVVRRPGVSALISLAVLVILIRLSALKYKVLSQTVTFVDIMIIEPSAVSYLLAIMPGLLVPILIALAVAVPTLALLWRVDPFRLPRAAAVAGALGCLTGIGGVSVLYPFNPEHIWYPDNHISNFARTGVDAITEFARRGYMESDAVVADRLRTVGQGTCEPAGKPPHIIMVHDESAFDIRKAPNINVPPGYGRHFRSFDGKQRDLIVEVAGGPSWYTEYNVLAGLSSRSFGRFAYFVTRIAAGRVERGLPNALRHCGYRTFSLYPAHGAFMGAKRFQASTGMQNFFDMRAMRARDVEPDGFYYDQAMRMIERQRAGGPMFLFIYLSANHFPWDYRWRPEKTPNWKGLGNQPLVDEYLRRQTLGMQDYRRFLDQLRREFPGERFMLVRYGDHQPDFATTILEPSLTEGEVIQRLMRYDPRYYTTYYAIDAINFRPLNITSMHDSVEAPYLPLIALESAGLPLDPSFAEQKKIFERCKGLFYSCNGGAEVRRFNRMLIDAGLIKGL